MRVLIVDVGGTKVKLWHSEGSEKRRFASGEELTAEQMVTQAREHTADWDYDVVALGLPCRVIAGRPAEEPASLGAGWMNFDYARAFGKPVRIINDACLQALGAYDGGRMVFLGLGTKVGSALVVNGLVMSLELGELRHNGDADLARTLGREGLRRVGHDKWHRAVEEIVMELRRALLADYLVVGGGQAKKLATLPDGVRRGTNRDALHGGVRLWHDYPAPEAKADDLRAVL